MTDLTTSFLSFTLKNPLMLTEGPLSGNAETIRRADACGAGLIFTKGIRPQPAVSPVPYIRRYERSLLNADWSDIGFASWLKVVKALDTEVPVITSIAKNYVTPDQAADMAVELVKAGSKAVSLVDYDPAQLIEAVRLTRSRVKVPLMVKLPPFLKGLEEVLKSLIGAGIDAVAAMDSIGPVMSIDPETGVPVMGSPDGSGYMSGRYILPITLKYIHDISSYIDIPVVGVGGVVDTPSAVQMIMAGATGVGMVTGPLLQGLEVFQKVAVGLESYLEEKHCNLEDIRGLARRKLRERTPVVGVKAQIQAERCTTCGACLKVCYAEAITAGEKYYTVNPETCVSCGLCDSVCSAGAVSFSQIEGDPS